jgi:SAM-dependent methyltransferase
VRHAIHAGRRVTGAVDGFDFDGVRYAVFRHSTNRTWLTERAVELAVAMRFVDGFGPTAAGLEVGNVLANYRPVAHRVVDKYERAPGVENIDVLDIATDRPLGFVVAISTLEHVGWDEPERDLDKPLRAIGHLRSLLRPDGGRMLITLPLGYNPGVDMMVLGGEHGAHTSQLFVRDRRQRWLPTDRPDPQQLRYEFELRTAAAVWIAEYRPR